MPNDLVERHVKYVVEVFENGENLYTAHSHVLSFAVGSFLDLCNRYGTHYHNEIDTFDTVGRGFQISQSFNGNRVDVSIYATTAIQ